MNLEFTIELIKISKISGAVMEFVQSLPNRISDTGNILHDVRELNRRLNEWADAAPAPLRPTEVIRPHCGLDKVDKYNILYLRYAYYGSIACLHSSIMQPYAQVNLGEQYSQPFHDQMRTSWELVVEASRAMINFTKYADINCGCPVW